MPPNQVSGKAAMGRRVPAPAASPAPFVNVARGPGSSPHKLGTACFTGDSPQHRSQCLAVLLDPTARALPTAASTVSNVRLERLTHSSIIFPLFALGLGFLRIYFTSPLHLSRNRQRYNWFLL